jgi:1,2-phenylacetyl-CoA epoxidase catalytic subunit
VTKVERKTKALALLSLIVAATVFGAVILSVSATDDEAQTEDSFHCKGLPPQLLEELTEEQREILQTMIDENQAEMEENRDAIEAQLEEWGIEIPAPPQHQGGFLEDLTEEQREELETMRQEYLESVKSKLEEWGIEVPEFYEMEFGRRGHGRFGPFGP